MRNRILIIAASLSLVACSTHTPLDRDELSAAKSAIAAAKAAGAESCAPKLQADAVASLYWAAHELSEGIHPEENAELIARSISKAKEAKAASNRVCKAKPAPKPKVEIIKLSGVNFANNSADLTAESTAILDRAVTALNKRSTINVEVAAHTSTRGSASYNMKLSDQRAASVMNYLVNHGINANRLTSRGYGETQPIASEATKAGEATNRRVELRVLN